MKKKTKTYARFKTRMYDDGGAIEIKDLQDAVTYGLENKMSFFETYEVNAVTPDGKTLSDAHSNLSGKHYLHVEKVLTAADIVAFCEAELLREDARLLSIAESFYKNPRPYPEELKGLTFAEEDKVFIAYGTLSLRDMFKEYPADKLFIDNPFGRGGEYIKLEKNDKAYNKSGVQIWPVPARPVRHAPKPGF